MALLLIVAGFGGLVLALVKLFPETRLSGSEWGDVAYMGGFLLLVASGLRLGLVRMGHVARHIGIWLVVAAVIALGYAYRDELGRVPKRLMLAFGAARPVVLADHELAIPQDSQGAFEVVGKVNGQPVRFVIDTGASETVLAPADARRLGIDTASLHYGLPAETANGTGYSAPYAARLEIGQIAFDDFPIVINQAAMSRSLLGLSFLNRLESFHIRGRTLYLTWREPAEGGA